MKENQKIILKAYIICFSGLLLSLSSLVFIPIYANVLKNPFGDFPVIILIILIFVGVFLIQLSSKYNILLISDFRMFIHPAITTGNNKWFIQGVPNNNYSEFALKFSQLNKLNEINIKEIKNGIYELTLNDKIVKFDMQGWIRKEYYIYEYILTIFQLTTINKIYKKSYFKAIDEVRIKFINIKGKTKYRYLIKKHVSCLNVLYKIRSKVKYKIISMYKKNGVKEIKNYYHFN